MKLRLFRRSAEASHVESFYFSKPDELDYQAGQYAQVKLPHTTVDERGDTRWLSLASSPTEDFVLFGMKFYKDGSSFKKAFQNLSIDDEIEIADPMGTFVLPQNPAEKILFVAGGIGITPYRSMLKYMEDTKQDRDISLLYAANTESEFIYQDVLEGVETELKYTTELLNANRIGEMVPDFDERIIYLSGPQPMIEVLYDSLQANGIDRNQIQLDYFPGYKDL